MADTDADTNDLDPDVGYRKPSDYARVPDDYPKMTPAPANASPPGAKDEDAYLRGKGITNRLTDADKKILDAWETEHREAQKLAEAHKAERDAVMAQIRNLQQPPPPALRNIPSAPPREAYKFQNPFDAFQNPAVFLAGIASFFTRQPLTAAFNTAAAAMEGFHKGDVEAIKQNVSAWKDNVEQAIAQNKVETERYTSLWNKYHDNYERLLSEMSAEAAGYKDDQLLNTIRYGGPKELWEQIEHRVQAGIELEKSVAEVNKATAQAEEAHAKAQAYTSSGLTEQGLDHIVDQLLAGATWQEAAPNLGRGIQGEAARNIITNRLTEKMHEEGITEEELINRRNNRAASKAASVSGARTAGVLGANLEMISRNLEAQIPAAEQAADKVGRSKWVHFNKAQQLLESEFSDPDLREFQVANLQVAELWARAMNPRGVMRESDRAFALENLNTADAPETYRRVLQQLRQFVAREQDATATVLRTFSGAAGRERANRESDARAKARGAGKNEPSTAPQPTPDADGWVRLPSGARYQVEPPAGPPAAAPSASPAPLSPAVPNASGLEGPF